MGPAPVFLERSDELPLVDVEVLLRRGSASDPAGRDGLSTALARVIRRGTGDLSAEAIDERIDGLGASLAFSVQRSTVRVQGTVIRRNLRPFVELLGRLLGAPRLAEEDVAQVRRTMEADLVTLRDADRSLAARAFRAHLFGEHPYGRSPLGTSASLRALSRDDLLRHHRQAYTKAQMVIGLAGDLDGAELEGWLDEALAPVADGTVHADGTVLEDGTPATATPAGPRVLVVDKPERTQTQLVLGVLGSRYDDPDHHALLVANAAFGGTFTSRLVREVRSERGWSYAAGSALGVDRRRDAWTVWTQPATDQLLDCLALELELLKAWVEGGLSPAEVERAKSFLIKSHPFDRDTPLKRLAPRLEAELHGLPLGRWLRFPEHVARVTPFDANRAVEQRFALADLAVVVVATATASLLEGLGRRVGVPHVDVVSFLDV
ncbi:MAG: M16 family metallopeptidase [Sandaracinaceae bacterium]